MRRLLIGIAVTMLVAAACTAGNTASQKAVTGSSNVPHTPVTLTMWVHFSGRELNTLNSIIGNVPVVGGLLVSRKGEGVFGLHVSLRGGLSIPLHRLRVVMLHALVSRVGVMAHACANARNFVCRNAHAYS